MSAFLVVAAPLWYLLIVSFFRTPSRGWRGILIPWFGGLLIGMAALLVTLSFLSRVPFGLDFNQLYFWVWLRGTGWPMVLGVPAVILAHIFKPTSYSRTRNAAGWFSGVATVYMIWTSLILDPGFDAYRVLFTPLVWIAMLALRCFWLIVVSG